MKLCPYGDRLSNRERTVLVHMLSGLSAEQIADVDCVSVTTVRTQIRAIMVKLGVKSQLAAVARAYQALWPTEDERREALSRVLENAS